MPDIQEAIALGIVALVAGRLLWRRFGRRKSPAQAGSKAGACSDCASAGPPPKETTIHFYRRREAGRPADGSGGDGT